MTYKQRLREPWVEQGWFKNSSEPFQVLFLEHPGLGAYVDRLHARNKLLESTLAGIRKYIDNASPREFAYDKEKLTYDIGQVILEINRRNHEPC